MAVEGQLQDLLSSRWSMGHTVDVEGVLLFLLPPTFAYLIFLWPLRLRWMLVLGLYMGVYLLFFKCLTFWLHGDCGKCKGRAFKPQVNHTGCMTVVAPADRPKSIRNSCVIERICSIVCRLGVFVIRLRQISIYRVYIRAIDFCDEWECGPYETLGNNTGWMSWPSLVGP